MAAETQYTANTGMVKISGANTSLTGSGTIDVDIWTVISSPTAGSNLGTLVKTVNIKAAVSTTQGMVRLFVYDGTNTRLLKEIEIPPMTINASPGTDPSFETTIKLDYKLKAGYSIRATTQVNETFHLIAEGLDWVYYTTSVRPESTKYTANNGLLAQVVDTANTALTGAGTLDTDIFKVYAAGTAASGVKGSAIESITIQATGTVTHGMIRIFVQDTGTATADTFLLTEIFVNPIVPPSGGTFKAFNHTIVFPEKFQITADYKIMATTQNSENFVVLVEGLDWTYPA